VKIYDGPRLEDYQLRLIDKVRDLIDVNFYRKPPHLRILDAGCDTSGKQLWHFANLTKGEVVGINVAQDFPSEESRKYARNNITLMNMDGMSLGFPDQSFDVVISANVMEHIRDPEKYINECCRVLKSSGIAYFETAPLWNSARGHHVHADMVAENCPEERNYKNDGSIIPDWSHLSLAESEMRGILVNKLSQATSEYILQYLYRSDDLNKTPWRVIKAGLESAFSDVSTTTWHVDNPDVRLRPQGNVDEFDIFGFSAICRKRRLSAISRRMIWRIRKLGW